MRLLALFGFFAVATVGTAQDESPGEAPAIPFDGSDTPSSRGLPETRTVEIDGSTLTFPVGLADTVAALKPVLELWLERRAASATQEAEGLEQAFRDPEIHDLVRNQVRSLLGGDPLSDGAEAVLSEGAEEIASFAERWRLWSGRPAAIRLFDQATMAPHRDGEKVSFDSLSYEGADGQLRIRLEVPLLSTRMGLDSFAPQPDADSGFSLDLPVFAPPGTETDLVATDLVEVLMEVQRMMRAFASGEAAQNAMHYLVERLLVHEIGSRFLADPPSPVVSRALARIYLAALLNTQRPAEEAAVKELLERLFSFEAPELPEARKAFAEGLAVIDPLGEVPEYFQDAASRILAFAIFQASQDDPRDKPPLQLFRAEGIETPAGGFGGAAFGSALERVWPDWPGPLEKAREELLERLRQPQPEVRRGR